MREEKGWPQEPPEIPASAGITVEGEAKLRLGDGIGRRAGTPIAQHGLTRNKPRGYSGI
jgi:hypothetical protein